MSGGLSRSVVPALLAATVGFLALGAYLVAWDLFVTQSACRGYEFGECSGAPVAMALVGLPVLYVAWAAGLRATAARFAGLAPLGIGIVLFAVARTLGPYDTSLLLWPVLTGVLSGVWRWCFGPVVPGRPAVSPGR